MRTVLVVGRSTTTDGVRVEQVESECPICKGVGFYYLTNRPRPGPPAEMPAMDREECRACDGSGVMLTIKEIKP